jgi:hypothetical protein
MDDAKKLLGMFSPAYGAVTGEGPMGRMTSQGLIGQVSKQYRNEQAADAASNKAAAADEAKKKRDAQYMAAVGRPAPYKKGGAVKADRKGGSASSRADGCAVKGKTRGTYI